ncbi:hypothetical protein OIU74_005307 [Salix koriyanagi]|uniref:Uncharacterized protein n=1 Tax=Salix koriyanagi TaxID=2511006 RepID=A0A9Q0UPG4_9ROSI|nr:hypothetical protein OIU74_005307 [Salix koriyanagi]
MIGPSSQLQCVIIWILDLLRKVMNTVFFNGEIKFHMSQEGYACFILDQLVALARADAWFLRNQVDKGICISRGCFLNCYV